MSAFVVHFKKRQHEKLFAIAAVPRPVKGMEQGVVCEECGVTDYIKTTQQSLKSLGLRYICSTCFIKELDMDPVELPVAVPVEPDLS